MNFRNLALAAAFMLSSIASASEIPRCWTADQPKADIIDGFFSVKAPTTQHSAQDVARLLNLTAFNTMGKQVIAASDLSGETITIELTTGDLVKIWRPTPAYPTIDVLKNEILKSFEPLLEYSGLTISCQKNLHPHPHPGGTVSN